MRRIIGLGVVALACASPASARQAGDGGRGPEAGDAEGAAIQVEVERKVLPTILQRALDRALSGARGAFTDEVPLKEDHSTFETAWEFRTAHFHVKTVHSRTLAERCNDLEQMLPAYQRILATDYAPDEPLAVFVFETLQQYNQYGENHGDQHSSFMGGFYAPGHPEQPTIVLYNRDPSFFRATLTHAFTHHYLAEAFPGARPMWFDEALASYFAMYWDYARPVALWKEMQTDDDFVPFDALLSANADDYLQRSSARLAELGLLFTWLLWQNPDTWSTQAEDGSIQEVGPFLQFVRDVLRGQNLTTHEFSRWMQANRDELFAAFTANEF